MKTIRISCISLLFLLSLLHFKSANADDTSPLVIVRFNQDNVSYTHSLARAVSSALRIKPTSFFDIVAVIPGKEGEKQYKRLKKTASLQTQNIARTMQQSGVQPNRLRISTQSNPHAASNEVHIFVR